MKILFAKGNSLYGTLRVYSDMLIEELRKHGHIVNIIDRTINGQWENIEKILDYTYDMVLSYQMLAFKAKVLMNNKGISTDDIKFVCLCGDHPIYLNYWLKSVKGTSKQLFLLLGDRNQLNCVKKYYPWINVNAFEKTLCRDVKEIKPYKNRTIDVYFGGSYYDVKEELEKINRMQNRDIALSVIHEIERQEGIPLECALEKVLQQRKISLSKDEFIDYMEDLIPVDRYIRGFYRNMYISAALDTGAKVSVFGYGWEQSAFIKYRNFNILEGETSLQKGYEYMSDSKIILNIMPWSRIGMHDRIIGALKVGAVCITNTNDIINREFGDKTGVRGCGLLNKEEIAKKITWILNHADEAEKIAKAGKQKVDRDYTMENYYDMVWEKLGEIGGI